MSAITKAKENIVSRCQAAGLEYEKQPSPAEGEGLLIAMKCGREVRWVSIRQSELASVASLPFEAWRFLAGYDAICSYDEGVIEAGLRHAAFSASFSVERFFGIRVYSFEKSPSCIIKLDPPHSGMPRIEISESSTLFKALLGLSVARTTLKLSGIDISTHDAATALLKRVGDSLLFQIDRLAGMPILLQRHQLGLAGLARRARGSLNIQTDLQYPANEYDDAPISLYWYGRSALGMPLLQFLAFYQVIEFYFPTYSQAEAQRKVRTLLKDPSFRANRDADIGKLLSLLKVSHTGAYGDERAQIRATLMECIHPQALRDFLEEDDARKEFYLGKPRAIPYHKIPVANPTADLRTDVAERIYDIRCKIVHTKSDAGDTEVDLLLPFSKEADQLGFDIELVQYIAQGVLIAASRPFQVNG